MFYGHLLKTRQKTTGSSNNNMIADAAKEKKGGGNYFVDCEIWAGDGPHVVLDPEGVLPQSVGYFR